METICSLGAELKLLCPLEYFIIIRVNNHKGLLSSTTLFCDYISIKLLIIKTTPWEVTKFLFIYIVILAQQLVN